MLIRKVSVVMILCLIVNVRCCHRTFTQKPLWRHLRLGIEPDFRSTPNLLPVTHQFFDLSHLTLLAWLKSYQSSDEGSGLSGLSGAILPITLSQHKIDGRPPRPPKRPAPAG